MTHNRNTRDEENERPRWLSHYLVRSVVANTLRWCLDYERPSEEGGAIRRNGTKATQFEVFLVGYANTRETRLSDGEAHKVYQNLQRGWACPREVPDDLYAEARVMYEDYKKLQKRPLLHPPSMLEMRLITEGSVQQDDTLHLLSS